MGVEIDFESGQRPKNVFLTVENKQSECRIKKHFFFFIEENKNSEIDPLVPNNSAE